MLRLQRVSLRLGGIRGLWDCKDFGDWGLGCRISGVGVVIRGRGGDCNMAG